MMTICLLDLTVWTGLPHIFCSLYTSAYLQLFPLFPGFLPLNITSVVLCLQRKAAGSAAGCRLTSSTVTSPGSDALGVSGNFSHNIPKPALDGDVRPPTTRARLLERHDTVWYNRSSVEIQNITVHTDLSPMKFTES